MLNRRVLSIGVIFAGCVTVVAAAMSAQSRQSPATLDDLLAELRALRADMAQSSGASIKTQLLVARLQLQEQRINGIGRQLIDVQGQLTRAHNQVSDLERRSKDLDDHLTQVAVGEREAQDMKEIKRELAASLSQAQQSVQDLTNQEGELSRQFTGEQARWNDFNDRLDALERSVSAVGR